MTGLLRIVTMTFTGSRKKNHTTTQSLPSTASIFAGQLLSNPSLFAPSVVPDGRVNAPLLSDADTFYSPDIGRDVFIAPPQLASTPVLFAPTVNEQIRLPLVSNSSTVFAPAVHSGITVVAPLLSDGETFYDATLNQRVTAGFASNSSALYAPSLYTGTTITAPLLSNGQTFYAAQLNLKLAAPLLTNAQAFPAAVVTGLSIKPSTFATAPAFYAPTLNLKLSAPLLNASAAIYAPVLSGPLTLSLFTNTQSFPGAKINRTLPAGLYTNTQTFYGPTVGFSAYSVTPPQIDTSVTSSTDNPPKFDVDTVDGFGAVVGDTIRLSYTVNGTTQTAQDGVLDDGEFLQDDSLFPNWGPFSIGDAITWKLAVVRNGAQVSNWGPQQSFTITTAAPLPAVKASSLVYVNNANSKVVPLPSGAAAGDRLILIATHGWIPSNPTGFTSLGGSSTSYYNILATHKVLSSGDISTGSVTMTFSGSYYGHVAAVCLNGSRSIRASTFRADGTGSSVRSLSTDATPQAGDTALIYAAARGNGLTITTPGTVLQSNSAVESTAQLSDRSINSAGVYTASVSYSAAGNGDAQYVIVVGP